MSGIMESIAGYTNSIDGSFQKYTIIVALVILIGTLAMMGAALYSSNGSGTFPPSSGPCPDYWTINGTNCVEPKDSNGNGGGKINYEPAATLCRKKKSLNEAMAIASNVSWDGVSNNKTVCPADYE